MKILNNTAYSTEDLLAVIEFAAKEYLSYRADRKWDAYFAGYDANPEQPQIDTEVVYPKEIHFYHVSESNRYLLGFVPYHIENNGNLLIWVPRIENLGINEMEFIAKATSNEFISVPYIIMKSIVRLLFNTFEELMPSTEPAHSSKSIFIEQCMVKCPHIRVSTGELK